VSALTEDEEGAGDVPGDASAVVEGDEASDDGTVDVFEAARDGASMIEARRASEELEREVMFEVVDDDVERLVESMIGPSEGRSRAPV
jgi:hypothetical protein